MKQKIGILIGVCVIVCSSVLLRAQYKQINIDMSNIDFSTLTAETQSNLPLAEIQNTVQEVVNAYCHAASFSENGEFSPDKAILFGSLFANGARHFDDTKEKDAYNMSVENYSDKVYEYARKEGIVYEIGNAFFTEIGEDASGYYIATVMIEKIVNTTINTDKSLSFDRDGRRVNFTMKIAMPSYSLADGKIRDMIGTSTKTYTESELSLSLGGLIGGVLGSSYELQDGLSADYLRASSIQTLSYGGEFNLRKSVITPKLNILVGVKAAIVELRSAIPSYTFTSRDRTSDEQIAFYESLNSDFPESLETNAFEILNSTGEFEETVKGLTVSPKLGISYRWLKNLKSRFYTDIAWSPTFKASWTDGSLMHDDMASGYRFPAQLGPDNVNVPNSDFPYEVFVEGETNEDYEQLLLTLDNHEEYQVNSLDEANPSRTNRETNFSLGSLILAPVYHFDIGTNWGFYAGADFQLFLSSLIPHSTDVVSEDFLSTTYQNLTELDDKLIKYRYYQSVKPFIIHAKIGAYYEIGN